MNEDKIYYRWDEKVLQLANGRKNLFGPDSLLITFELTHYDRHVFVAMSHGDNIPQCIFFNECFEINKFEKRWVLFTNDNASTRCMGLSLKQKNWLLTKLDIVIQMSREEFVGFKFGIL